MASKVAVDGPKKGSRRISKKAPKKSVPKLTQKNAAKIPNKKAVAPKRRNANLRQNISFE
jgi:hypothetical protein